MVRLVHTDRSEITLDHANLPDAPARTHVLESSSGRGVMNAAVPGGKLLRCIVVSFGLLCVLQAALNICLRLALSSQLKSVTEERDELKRKLNVYNNYSDQGWIYFNGHFYLFSSIKKNWHDSRDDCKQRDADLIIINSEQEQEFTRHFRETLWIGLTDRETEGEWKWVDGTLLTRSFWCSGEPNNYKNRNEDCVETNFDDQLNWNDIPCGNQNLWICEKKIDL